MSTSTDTSTTISVSAFKVDLAQLADAITSVQGSAERISGYVDQIKASLNAGEQEWSSPAYQTFAALVPDVNTDMDTLVNLMNEMVTRMQSTYNQYSSIELTNT